MPASSKNLFWKCLLVGGAGIFGVMAYQKKLLPIGPSADPSPSPTPTPSTKKAKAPVPLSAFPLKKGSQGDYVKMLQKHLGVSADGIFGPATEAALLQRYGKKQVTTLAELTTLVKTGSSVPTKPGTAPSLPKPTAATPSTATSDYQKKLVAQMWVVFNAIWSKTGGSSIYTEKLVGDWKAINPVLGSLTDGELKGFAAAYARSFKNLSFPKTANRMGTLLNDLSRIGKVNANAYYFQQVDRVKKLS